jgi:hypothetical protein
MPSNLITGKNGQVKKGPGRPKGSPNKINKAAKDAIAEAAEALGGAARMVAWVKEDPANEKAFWTQIYPKLVPVQLTGDPDSPVNIITRVELVAPNGNSKD